VALGPGFGHYRELDSLKQFLVLSGKTSLFQQAVNRVNQLGATDIAINETLIVTNEEHRFLSPRSIT
jgi:mannose-1-phosphate guanylyltransferase